MVYNTQNYCVSGLCTSSAIVIIRKHDVSETGSEDGDRSSFLVFRNPDDGQDPESQ
jgi:hypothetical protein